MKNDLIFGLWCHFQQYFSYIMATSFSDGRSRSTLTITPMMWSYEIKENCIVLTTKQIDI